MKTALKCFVVACGAAAGLGFGFGMVIVCMRHGFVWAQKLGGLV